MIIFDKFTLFGNKNSCLQNHIFVDGTQALQHEFKSLLNRHGHPVPPVIIVDMLSSEEGEIPINMFLEKYIKYSINSWYAWM